jgi:hypothetical protein
MSRRDQLLIALACDGTSKKVAAITQLLLNAGLRGAKNWSISKELSRAKGLAVLTQTGWELTGSGRLHVVKVVGGPETRLADVATSLRTLLSGVTSPDVKAFLEEAVSCYEHKFYRAAIMLSWVGAIAILHQHVFDHKLAQFNAEATRRTQNSRDKWRNAVSLDDLGRMTEHEFLQVIDGIGVLDKNVRVELEKAL